MKATLEQVHHALRDEHDYVLLCPAYPRMGRSGGEFIRTRVKTYAAAGLRGAVVEYSPSTKETTIDDDDDALVVRIASENLEDVIRVLAGRYYPVLTHSPTPAAQDMLREHVRGQRLVVWFHGYEVRDHRRLFGNYTSQNAPEFALLFRPPQRWTASAAAIFKDPDITKVFVSQFQLHASEFDLGVRAENAVVIPNHIDVDLFDARIRKPEEVTSILLMRSFRARNYGNDIALRALQFLSNRSGFSDLRVTVRGFGPLFRAETANLLRLENVDIVEQYLSPVEMAVAHSDHGVFLCPSRFDTQGVMLGEAMASGMVCVTNRVAAIPEFTNDSCSLMVKPGDPRAFGEAIWALVENPESVPVLSRNAAERVRNQCGYDRTIARELQLIRSGGHS